jgi:serine/threonine-protein kinase
VVTPIRETRFSERFATLSPDGRFVAFETTESGRREIVIQSFPDPGVRVQVTRDGGEAPLWAGNLELFFWRGNRLFGVPVATAPELSIGEPVELFSTDRYTTNLSREYDVSVDGQRVLLTRTPKEKKPREAQIVLNWFSELEQLAGPGGSR